MSAHHSADSPSSVNQRRTKSIQRFGRCFSWVTDEGRSLTPTAFRLLILLIEECAAGFLTGRHCTRAHLCERMGAHENRIRDALRELRACGLISDGPPWTVNGLVDPAIPRRFDPPKLGGDDAPELGAMAHLNQVEGPTGIRCETTPDLGGQFEHENARGEPVSPVTRTHTRTYARKQTPEKTKRTPEKVKTVAAPLSGPLPDKPNTQIQEAPQLALVSPPDGVPEGIQCVFLAWQSASGQAGARLIPERVERIQWALREYGLAETLRAVKAVACSDWHMGRDPKSNGKRWNDLTLILRDHAKVEFFRQLAEENGITGDAAPSRPAAGAVARSTMDFEWQRDSNAFFDESNDTDVEAVDGDCDFVGSIRPIGFKRVHGILFWLFRDAVLSMHAETAAAAQWAGAELVRRYPNNELADDIAAFNNDSAREFFTSEYAKQTRRMEELERAS